MFEEADIAVKNIIQEFISGQGPIDLEALVTPENLRVLGFMDIAHLNILNFDGEGIHFVLT